MSVAMMPVEGSTNIQKIGYDHLQRELHIEFSGGSVYVFTDVPPQLHTGLMHAKSKGSFFHANLKGQFQHRKLDQEAKPTA